MNKTLINESFVMPAEFEKQKSVWVVWPHNKNDWPGHYETIPSTVAKIVSTISVTQKVNLIIRKTDRRDQILKIISNVEYKKSNINFYKFETDRIWIRDTGPIYVKRKKNNEKVILNFRFNGWSKYHDYKKDNLIPNLISKSTRTKQINPNILLNDKIYYPVLEGGAFDVNGKGTVLLTKECLLGKKQERNPGFKKLDYQRFLNQYLGVSNFVWLNKGIKGDDTHGHIDDISRFVSSNTIMTGIELNKKDENYKLLNENLKILKRSKNLNGKKFKIIAVPMPDAKYVDKIRVPASYLNFLITNNLVILPIFKDKNDYKAISIFKKYFKKRKIITIDCSKLIWGFGAIHCMTQQEPKI